LLLVNTDAIDPEAVPVRPAATVIPLRDSPAGLEVLVLRRDSGLAFHGGSWVFPGGRVDDDEIERSAGDDLAAARLAAAREAQEEAGLEVDPWQLITLSHWTTPFGRNRRFATWFFVVAAPGTDVVIDDGEIREFEWHTVSQAIEGCDTGRIALAGPAYVSLLRLQPFGTVAEALTAVDASPDQVFLPRLVRDGELVLSVYQEDPAYETGDLGLAGPQHRMHMLKAGYRYIDELSG
jgi:8-oxo-dGTP pyrophosphatase MutT (NUDIX family)